MRQLDTSTSFPSICCCTFYVSVNASCQRFMPARGLRLVMYVKFGEGWNEQKSLCLFPMSDSHVNSLTFDLASMAALSHYKLRPGKRKQKF